MNDSQRPQDIVVKPMENTCPKERKVRPHKEQASNCPRCNSNNTKFCYYNNYSLSQPRYFCKTCRRYWTEGGSLRNIPVGGGSRKNKIRSSSRNINNLSNSQIPQNPSKIRDQITHQDLNLGFPSIIPHDFKAINDLIQVPNFDQPSGIIKEIYSSNPSCSTSTSSHQISMPIIDPNMVYSSGFSLPEFKPSLNFSLDGLGSSYGNFQESSGKLLFPYEDLNKKVMSSNSNDDKDKTGDSSGYWNGMMSGGGSW